MPLHLLGKKSWNVYNSANIERVKHDEAVAKAQEEADEQRLQLEDAAIRTSILRGEQPTRERDHSSAPRHQRDRDDHRAHKRRRLRGEDDTDRDIRWAREDAEVGIKVRSTLSNQTTDDRPLHDQDGHIQLVPVPATASAQVEKNAEVEAEVARQKQRDEDQYTMRFSNAAGFKNGLVAPWYADAKTKDEKHPTTETVPGKDVWGNEDPRRKERDQKRMIGNDPLAFMRQAQRQLKQSERDREHWKKEKAAELRELERDQRRSRKHSLDEIPSLDLAGSREHGRQRSHRHHRRHRDRRDRTSSREDRGEGQRV